MSHVDVKSSHRFNAADSDVTFLSDDRVLFKLHRRNLELASGGFPTSDFETLGESVVLSEAAMTLELLFQYVYPNPLPDIQSQEFTFTEIVWLGEAAEKYQVFSAMCICEMYMKHKLQEKQHMTEVLAYGAKYGYTALADEAATLLLGVPLFKIFPGLPRDLINPWLHYYCAWERVFCVTRSHKFKPASSSYTDKWGRSIQGSGICQTGSCHHNVHITRLMVLERLENMSSLQNLGLVFADIGCSHFREELARWENETMKIIQLSTKNFHEYLNWCDE